jgi:hypothetical protein
MRVLWSYEPIQQEDKMNSSRTQMLLKKITGFRRSYTHSRNSSPFLVRLRLVA